MLSPALRVGLAVNLALAALATAGAATASAGEYNVNVCRHADGSIAPTDGWLLAIEDDVANVTAANTCAFGGQIDLELRAGTTHGRFTGSGYTGAELSFSATPPPATAWREAEVWWAYRSNPSGAASGSEQIAGSIADAPRATCAWGSVAISPCSARGSFGGPPLNPINASTVQIAAGQSTGRLKVKVSCDSAPLACPSVQGEAYAELRLWRLRATLTDNVIPAFSAQPTFPARAGGKLSVALSATDGGSGVRSAQFIVDGAALGSPQVIDERDGRCSGRPDGSFDHLVPCGSSTGSIGLAHDITSLPGGPHSVSVRITDAAGNSADSEPRSVTVDNPVPLSAIPVGNPLRGRGHVHNGSGNADTGTLTAGLRRGSTGNLRATMRVPPRRRVRLAGRLVGADRKPIAGARLSVTTAGRGVAPKHMAVRTRANGTYSASLGWGPTRKIDVAWYPWGDSTKPLRGRGVRLLGMASVTLRVSPERPRNGTALHFAGGVVGAPAGARVIIQVRVGRFWRTFLVPAVDGRGRYRGRRTLLRSAGVSYCLRARVLSQPGFQYSAGSSRHVCRRVR